MYNGNLVSLVYKFEKMKDGSILNIDFIIKENW